MKLKVVGGRLQNWILSKTEWTNFWRKPTRLKKSCCIDMNPNIQVNQRYQIKILQAQRQIRQDGLLRQSRTKMGKICQQSLLGAKHTRFICKPQDLRADIAPNPALFPPSVIYHLPDPSLCRYLRRYGGHHSDLPTWLADEEQPHRFMRRLHQCPESIAQHQHQSRLPNASYTRNLRRPGFWSGPRAPCWPVSSRWPGAPRSCCASPDIKRPGLAALGQGPTPERAVSASASRASEPCAANRSGGHGLRGREGGRSPPRA